MDSHAYSEEERLNCFLEILNGVIFLHSKAIIHRDIKPENILIIDGSIVISDFGIAYFEEDAITYIAPI
jgi:serine/threonine protein kinase